MRVLRFSGAAVACSLLVATVVGGTWLALAFAARDVRTPAVPTDAAVSLPPPATVAPIGEPHPEPGTDDDGDRLRLGEPVTQRVRGSLDPLLAGTLESLHVPVGLRRRGRALRGHDAGLLLGPPRVGLARRHHAALGVRARDQVHQARRSARGAGDLPILRAALRPAGSLGDPVPLGLTPIGIPRRPGEWPPAADS